MSKKHQSIETGNDLSDTEFDTFDGGATRSRMAREAKIGLGVIVILLIVFGFVLYKRLPNGNDTSAGEAEADAAAPEAEDAGKPAADPFKSGPSLADPSQPTFVEAKVGTGATVARAPSPDPDPWRVRTVDSFAQRNNSGTAAGSPSSSSIPDLVPVKPADRYAGYRGSQTGGEASTRWGSEQSGGFASAESRPYASFGSASTQAGSGSPQSAAQTTTEPAGPNLWNSETNLPSPPAAQPTSNPSPWSTEALNPPNQETAATARTPSMGPATYSRRSGYTYQPSQSSESGATQARTPSAPAGPEPTYGTSVPSSDPTQQIGVPAGSSSRNDLDSRLSSTGSTASGDTSRQWSFGAAAAQTPPNSTYASPQTALSGSSSRQDAGRITTGRDGTYVVQPNDNYWVISERLYGTGAYFQALAHHNRAKTPEKNRLQMGDTILAPDVAELERAYPDLCPKPEHREATQRRTLSGSTQGPTGTERVYVVQQGDNLFDIARYELGKATRWTEIVDLNQQLLGSDLNDLNYLTPGMKLILPRDEPAGPVTQRSGSLYQR